MKLTDHESDSLAAARLDPPDAPNRRPADRESWLDQLARHLGATPIDHITIPPVSFAPAKACGTDVNCSE